MTEVIKETVTTQDSDLEPVASTTTRRTAVKRIASPTLAAEYLVNFVFGLLEILLAFRLILKLTGASTASPFVDFIYAVTRIFILPFEGIFRRGYSQGLETTSVLEPSTLVAMAVYAVLSWGIVKLIRITSGEPEETV